MSAVQRAAAFVVAVLLVAIVAVVLLSGTDGPIGRGIASPTPTSSPAGTTSPTPAGTASPAASPDDDVLAALAEIEEQVIAIRGLPAAEIGPAEILSRDELAAELEALFEADYPPEERERDNLVVRAFGLLGPDQDVGELQLQLLSEQVVGFYDYVDKRMVVVADELDAEAKITYAHEYTHALQDAAFGLENLETDAPGEDDRGLARLALQEGDATLTMLVWALRHLSQEELMEVGSGPVPDTADVPGWMLNQLLFPYVAGQNWIIQIMEAEGGGGNPLQSPDYTPVDAAFGDPPDSTAQIIDVEKWFDRIQPVDVEVGDLAAALGDGWEEVDASPVGQASIGILLEHFGVPDLDVETATSGWAGDRAVVVRGPDGAFALAWRITWETEEPARAFESAYATVVEALGFPAVASRDGDTVFVAHGSDSDILRRTVDAVR